VISLNTNFINRTFKALLFDFDGTLLDSFSVHFEVFKVVFARFGIEIDKEHFINTYSPNWYKSYEAMGLPEKDWKSADKFWVETAEKRRTNLFPGVPETLTKLCDSHVIGLVTSGTKSRVVKDLERTGIGAIFKTVVTGDDIQKPKPFPEGLEKALSDLGLQPHQAVYIGDAYADYEMAQAAGVDFIGVKSAYGGLDSDDSYRYVASVVELPYLFSA